jgi:hypothetical protein
MVNGRRVDRRAWPRSGRCHRQGEGVIWQDNPGTSEGLQGREVGEEGDEDVHKDVDAIDLILALVSAMTKFATADE